MMENIDSNSYTNLQEVEQLCQGAAENGIKEKGILSEILDKAAQRNLAQWAPEVKGAWEKGLKEIYDAFDSARKDIPAEDCRLLKAMMNLGFDSRAWREGYLAAAKTVFFGVYPNRMKLTEAMGFRKEDMDLLTLSRRWKMMELLKIGTWIYEANSGVGTINAVDKVTGELMVKFPRTRFLPLSHYLNKTMAIKQGSKLEKMLKDQIIPQYTDKQTFFADMRECVLTLDADLPLEDTIKKILVPAVISDEEYNKFLSGGALEASNVKAEENEKPNMTFDNTNRWDNNKSIDGMVNDLKEQQSCLKVDDVNFENVVAVLSQAADNEKQCEYFAQAIAYLWHEPSYQEPLRDFFKEIAPKACIWNDSERFVTVTDKMPGRLVSYWFDATKAAKGSEYLVEQTIKLPYVLWGNVETLLKKNKAEEKLLAERVYRGFETGRVNAEMFYWLWKAPHEERRSKYLSNSPMLFKTLRTEVRGSYLKSQRALRRMLVDDESFQRTVMRDGDDKDVHAKAVETLVRCVKHMPLLDAGERQSLLVKIVRIYPDFIHIVEEKTAASASRLGVKLTSNRSYRRCQLELKNLIEVKIPENTAAIEYARSLGDLRENSEFKFAKENQRLLGKKRGELEKILDETRPTDYRNVKIENTAIPGCSVEITFENGKVEEYFLLGRLDTDPSRNMISYETPLGKLLTGTKVGSELEMPSGENATLTAVKPLSEEMLTWLGETNIPEDEIK